MKAVTNLMFDPYLLCTLILLTIILEAPSYADEYDSFMIRGLMFSEKNQYDYAISDFTKAIKLNPKCTDAYDARGSIYAKTNKLSLSLADYEQAIKLQPKKASFHNCRAGLLFVQKKYSDALTSSKKAVELEPGNKEYRKFRGLLSLCSDQPTNALSDLRVVLNAKETAAEREQTYRYIGMCNFELGDMEKAKSSFEKAEQLSPTCADAFVLMSLVSNAQKDYDQAFMCATKAILLSPSHSQAHLARAEASFGKGQYEEALSDCKKALNNKNSQALYVRGQVLEAQGNSAEARSAFQEFIERMPTELNNQIALYGWLAKKRLASAKTKLASGTLELAQ